MQTPTTPRRVGPRFFCYYSLYLTLYETDTLRAVASPGPRKGEEPLQATVYFFDRATVQRQGQMNKLEPGVNLTKLLQV